MIIQQTASVRLQEPISVLSFALDTGPLLLMSLIFSMLLFFCWYFAIERTNQRKKQRLWFVENEGLIQQYKVLHHHLESFGRSISCCKHCKNDKMQLWNYEQHQLLVVRCRSCKKNYTFTKEHNELMQQILFQMEGVVSLVNTVFTYRHHPLGKLLGQKLAIDIHGIKPDDRPLELMHFTASKLEEIKSKSILDIFIYDWEVVVPERSALLAS